MPPDSNRQPTCPQCGQHFPAAKWEHRTYCSSACYHKSQKLVDPIWSRVEFTPTCHLFYGRLSESGYGEISVNGNKVRLHRYIWEQVKGPIPGDMFVCHRCNVRNCIRLDHLYLDDHDGNMRYMAEEGRAAKGGQNGKHTHPEKIQFGDAHPNHLHPERLAHGVEHFNAKLDDDAVRQIRVLLAKGLITNGEIAERFGVGRTTIGNIDKGLIWKHVV